MAHCYNPQIFNLGFWSLVNMLQDLKVLEGKNTLTMEKSTFSPSAAMQN